MNKITDDRDGIQWNIQGGDFNLDGVFSISDLWSGFKWLYFYIGDWLHFHILYTLPSWFSQFLELDVTYYSGWLSGVTSLFIWLIALGIFTNLYETLNKGKYNNDRTMINVRIKQLEESIKLRKPLGYDVDELVTELMELMAQRSMW
jgi:hypothetical protein